MANLTGVHALLILAVIVLLFGATKLPGLARGLGQSVSIFRKEVAPDTGEDKAPPEQPRSTT